MSEIAHIPEVQLPIEFDAQVALVAEWAAELHTNDAEFHHFPHSWRTYEVAMELADEFEASGVTISRRPLAFAALTHDIYTHIPKDQEIIEERSFASKEERSAWLTFHFLLAAGFDEESVARPTGDLILTTAHAQSDEKPEAIILRMADIHNTADSYEVFEERAQAFYRETCRFEGKSCSFAEWLPGAMDYLEGFLTDNLPSWFVDRSRANIRRIRITFPSATASE
jgi:hypothetical protein